MIHFHGREIRGFIFDMDGVLLDSWQAHADSWEQWGREVGVEFEIDDFMRKNFGKSLDQILPKFFPDRAGDKEFFQEMGEIKERKYREMLREDPPDSLPGLRGFLEAAREKDIKTIVGSSGPRENVRTTIEVLGFNEFFPQWVSADDVQRGKPHPDIFLKCAEKIGLNPQECLVFEDSKPGMEAAKSAGCLAVALLTMHEAHEVEDMSVLAAQDFTVLRKHLD